jgi:PII-like signaling protein
MNTKDVIMVRVYITESSHLLKTIVNYLKHDIQIRGLSVFRAISGFGESGDHSSSLLDLSLDLPLVIEFFDEQTKTDLAIEYLSTLAKRSHIVSWAAKTNA